MIVNTINSNSAKHKKRRNTNNKHTHKKQPDKDNRNKTTQKQQITQHTKGGTHNFNHELQPLLLIKSISTQQTN